MTLVNEVAEIVERVAARDARIIKEITDRHETAMMLNGATWFTIGFIVAPGCMAIFRWLFA